MHSQLKVIMHFRLLELSMLAVCEIYGPKLQSDIRN